MRTATLIFVAVLSAAAMGPQAYGLDSARDSIPSLASGKPAAKVEIAADNTPDTLAADRLGNGLPATSATVEIPPAPKDPEPPATAPAEPGSSDGAAASDSAQDPPPSVDPPQTQQSVDQQPQPFDQQTDEATQADLPPHVYSLQDFVSQGIDESPLGIELREDCTKLESHEKVCGLAVLQVRSGSPADHAGVKRYTALTHDLLDGASVAAALVFPPAIVAVAVIDQTGVGESFDLVIGVDGRRVRHILDFQDMTTNIRPGDTVYLTIVRQGKRIQLPVQIPGGAGSAAFRN